MGDRLKRLLVGAPRDLQDPRVFHSITLIAFLAWVGLGADGLSSSAYGPEESFRTLGSHHYLAVVLAVAVAGTIFLLSYSYGKIIEHFPFGGGGYVVATRLLGPGFGLVSGAALLIDYVLTISVSIAAGADAILSFLPLSYLPLKMPLVVGAIIALTAMNLRGVKESVTVLLPVFLLFLLTHAVMILGTLLVKAAVLPAAAAEVQGGFVRGLADLGLWGLAALFLRAYTMGAGTYTGIEAVSNGIQIMREPKVATAKKTMVYMAVSLAAVTGGITLGYLLVHAEPAIGKTMNAVLVERFISAAEFSPALGRWFVGATLFAEAALLFVAAQAGFIDGPRVMANMANDSWLPNRFATLSDRLTMQDGVLLMSGASLLTLLYSHGQTHVLILMYSIMVFVTFSLSQLSMVRFWWRRRGRKGWARELSVPAAAFVVCAGMLAANIYEKFGQGGWVTLASLGALVTICLLTRRHYDWVQRNLHRLDEILTTLPDTHEGQPPAIDPKAPTAVLLVGGYRGLGIHCLLAIQRLFPAYFKNFIFVSVGVVDSATFKGVEEVEEVRRRTEESLKRYVDLARRWGLAADYRMGMSTEVVSEAEQICTKLSKKFPRMIVFAGKLVFEQERWFQRLLHNETAILLQRRLQFSGLSAMVLPVRVLTSHAA